MKTKPQQPIEDIKIQAADIDKIVEFMLRFDYDSKLLYFMSIMASAELLVTCPKYEIESLISAGKLFLTEVYSKRTKQQRH